MVLLVALAVGMVPGGIRSPPVGTPPLAGTPPPAADGRVLLLVLLLLLLLVDVLPSLRVVARNLVVQHLEE